MMGEYPKTKNNWRDNYYIGLDIGTTSVGWAVTDENYIIPRVKGKRAWGVRLFEEANTAAERRVFRSVRRRKQREKLRVKYLRQIFEPLIAPIDKDFYMRMDDSFFAAKDKRVVGSNTLFNDVNYQDKDYASDFPTIWHLRKHLIECAQGKAELNPNVDVRHYYIAIAHILTNRGHFLFSGDFNISSSFTEIWEKFERTVEEFDLYFTDNAADEIKQLVCDNSKTLNDKKRELKDLLAVDRMGDIADDLEKRAKNLLELMMGSVKKLADIFDVEGDEKIDFKKSFEDKIEKAFDIVSEDDIALLETARAIYDFGKLSNILDGEQYLSFAAVNLFDLHASDLALLKEVLPEDANKHFYYDREIEPDKDINYVAYAKGANLKGKKKRIRSTNEDFVKKCKELITDLPNTNTKEQLEQRLAASDFMPLQKGYFQGVIPNQLHKSELEEILKSLGLCCPEFSTKNTSFINDPSNVADLDKIKFMLAVRYPYWAGPLGKPSNQEMCEQIPQRQRAWAVKRTGQEQSKVYPWNFEQVIDQGATAKAFIERMTNKCTYLYDQPVLPKNSLLYKKYMVLNDINNIKLNDKRISSVELKKKLYKELFSAQKSVSVKKIKEFIKCETGEVYDVKIADADDVAGRAINSNLSSYRDFVEVFGESFIGKYDDEIEQAILAITSLPESQELVLEELKQIFVHAIENEDATDEQLTKISKKQYGGWAKLSKMLLAGLCGVDVDPATGELKELKPYTIIEQMWNTNKNFMELVATADSEFAPKIGAHNATLTNKDPDAFVLESWASPPVKRAIFQTKKIIDELIDLIGKPPSQIFIETTREESAKTSKKRTTSRHKDFLEKYKSLAKDHQEVLKELEQTDEQTLKSKRLFLYFSQMGKCAYCGKAIELNKLNTDLYDIDHIVPRSFIKDDSLHNNLVLVHRAENATKLNNYPLPPHFQEQKRLWEYWQQVGLINKTKLERLGRTEPLTQADKEGFIARQLVETSQAVKLIRDLLKMYLPDDTKVVLAKAGVSSDFRRQMKKDDVVIKPEFVKVRELNDLHHAKDAYLAVVCGNVLNAKFTDNPRAWFAKKNDLGNEENNLSKIFWFEQKAFGGNKKVWDTDNKNGLMANVIKTMERNDILVTAMLQNKTSKGRGFYNEMIVSAAKYKYAIKTSDVRLDHTEKYGGYEGETYGSLILVCNKKKKPEFVPIPTRYSENPYEVIGDKEVLLEGILFNTLVKRDGIFPVRIVGGSEIRPAVQNILCADKEAYYKRITKLWGDKGKLKEDKNAGITKSDNITTEQNNNLYRVITDKLDNSIYKHHPKADSLLEQLSGSFEDLKLEEQTKVIYELMKFFQTTAPQALDLVAIGGKGGDNRLRLTSFGDLNKMIIIKQSVTGLLEKEIKVSDL